MSRALKSRIASALGLVAMLTLPAEGRSADAPLRKALLAPAERTEVVPRRGPRMLSRREIFQAIQNNLAQKGISGRGELRPEDLRIQSSLPVLNEPMGLEVTRVGYDAIRRETVFELRASGEPQYLPFKVTTRLDPQSLGLQQVSAVAPTEAAGPGGRTAGQAMGRVAAPPPVLAKPGRAATLIMRGQNLRITTTVVPLQPGIKGQCILVRDLFTSRVISAEVVDEGLLQTSF